MASKGKGTRAGHNGRLAAKLARVELSDDEAIVVKMRIRDSSWERIAGQLGVTQARARELYESVRTKADALTKRK